MSSPEAERVWRLINTLSHLHRMLGRQAAMRQPHESLDRAIASHERQLRHEITNLAALAEAPEAE